MKSTPPNGGTSAINKGVSQAPNVDYQNVKNPGKVQIFSKIGFFDRINGILSTFIIDD